MIIGKPIIAGGGKGLVPKLDIRSNPGSVIDIVQGGVILQTYTLSSTEKSHTFIVGLGTYTVNATLNGSTITKTVLVDAVARFVVKVPQPYYLLANGVPSVSLVQDNNYYADQWWHDAGFITVSQTSYSGFRRLSHGNFANNGTRCGVILTPAIDVELYNRVKIDFAGYSQTANYAWATIQMWDNDNAQHNYSYHEKVLNTAWSGPKYQTLNRDTHPIEFNIASEGTKKLGFGFACNGNNGNPPTGQQIDLYNLWYE